ncbi:U-box domain-containing protein 33-like [Zingiber officinale]|uniref:U-box domain-containing protein 33-like n=1 Tax=Zingiber officinale TaxID=94328 RepID=UPI001C4D6B54|nr:U-box domain-containing protein 33-like [Zingiber officinale]
MDPIPDLPLEPVAEEAIGKFNSSSETIHVAVGKENKKEKQNLLWVMRNFPRDTIGLVHVHWHSKWILTDFGVKFNYKYGNEQSQAKHREDERRKMQDMIDDYKDLCAERMVTEHHTEHEDVVEGVKCLVEKCQIKRLVIGSRSMANQISILQYCQFWHVRKGKLISTRFPCSEVISEKIHVHAQREYGTHQFPASHLVSRISVVNDGQLDVTPANELEERDGVDQDIGEVVNSRQEALNYLLRQYSNERSDTTSSISVELERIEMLLQEVREKLCQTEQEKPDAGRKAAVLNLISSSFNRRRKDNDDPATPPHIRQFTETQVKKATDNFSECKRIGEGGYGPVYKARLLGNDVAIKMLSPKSNQSQKEYHQELKVLSMIEHPHIVKLIGVCSELSALVYEYLPHRSLSQRLARGLKWQDRIRIISEQRSALMYLHSSPNRGQPIVHADLKFSNILLDEDDISRLSDFGTARVMHRGLSKKATFCHNTNPMGTPGYMDPAFAMSGELTPQSDIYSFGIVILRLLTGSPELNIAKQVEEAIRKGAVNCILDASAGDWPAANAKQLLQLALRCCNIDRKKRPSLRSAEWRALDRLRAMAAKSFGSSI